MVKRVRGASSLGCLVVLLLLAAVAYFGSGVGEIYWRRYRFLDAMKLDAQFAGRLSDEQIRRHLQLVVDSIGLPSEAANIRVRRSARRIVISSAYSETVDLPFFRRVLEFAPNVDHAF